MKRIQTGSVPLVLILGALTIAGVVGWVCNIVKFVGMDFGHITGMLVVRGIGIFLAPLGAVLGFL